MAKQKQRLGRWGEERAAEYLQQQGLTLLERNFRTPYGELDLVMQAGETLVFVEVKTRSSLACGYPEEAVTPKKREHLVNSAEFYLQEHPQAPEAWRVDVIAIVSDHGKTELEWFENALE